MERKSAFACCILEFIIFHHLPGKSFNSVYVQSFPLIGLLYGGRNFKYRIIPNKGVEVEVLSFPMLVSD